MNTTRKPILILSSLLAGIALMASCSREPSREPVAPGASSTTPDNTANAAPPMMTKAEKAAKQAVAKDARNNEKISKAAMATTAFSDEKISLNATRDGQYVTLTWQIGATIGKIQQMAVLRSPTGVARQTKVAELDTSAASHKDCLPDAGMYWYWLGIVTGDNKTHTLGPVKVGADRAGDSHYIEPEKNYKANVTRSLDIATIKWSFPEDELRSISIVRNKRLIKNPFGGNQKPNATPVLTTLTAKSQSTDPLPDANSEYWYWFKITLNSGAIIYKGPIKAEYTRSAKSNQ